MKPRLIIVLALIVLSPLAVAGWLGARIVRDERIMVEHRLQALVAGQLRAVAGDIDQVLLGYRDVILQEMSLAPTTSTALRERAVESPYVRQYYLLNDQGNLVHPALDDPESWTASEREALERTLSVWSSRALVDAGPEEIEASATSAQSLVARRQIATIPPARWHAWYWGDGLQLMLWYSTAAGMIHAAEVDRMRLLSEIIAALPDTDPAGTGLDGRLVLVGSTGIVLYQWGEFEPVEDDPPVASLALSPPLGSWSLEYYAPEGTLGSAVVGGLVLNLFAGMALVGALVLGSGYYLYREHTREMREAAQRVSFVNQVSHELKTPLTNIRMYAEMLEREVPPEAERAQRQIGVVVQESQRLSRLIGNILTFSRQQRKTLEIHRRSGVVDTTLQACLDHFRPALETKGIEVQFEPGAARLASFDPDVLEQIVGNLISNVEKYAAGGKLLKVASTQHGDELRVLVTDAGEGIPSRERDRVFQPFYRVDDSLTEGVAGTGIGLSIARELARLHGGDLTLLPARDGACFRLTLHCPQVAAGEA